MASRNPFQGLFDQTTTVAVMLLMTIPLLALSPMASAQSTFVDDTSRLAECAGKPDSCLTDAFFLDDDDPNTWSIPYLDPIIAPSDISQDVFLLTLEDDHVVARLGFAGLSAVLTAPDPVANDTWFHAAMTYEPGLCAPPYRNGVDSHVCSLLNGMMKLFQVG